MRLKSQIFQIHDLNFKRLKQRAHELVEDLTPELAKYQKNQSHFAKREFNIVPLKNLFKRLKSSDIVFVADFHTFDQNAKNFERLLRFYGEREIPTIIALEMVHAELQEAINSFLVNKISEIDFLHQINYTKSWHFPWSHYRGIFLLAKKFKFPVIGLNSKGTLKERDLFAANLLYKIHRNYPTQTLLTFFGELHIYPNKIPKQIERLAAKDKFQGLSMTILYQNLDTVFSKLKSNNINFRHALVAFSETEFSLQNALPWLKYESMLYWFENFHEDPEFDIHQYSIKKGMKIFGGNTPNHFLLLCQNIIDSFNLNHLDKSEVHNFNLYDHSKSSYIEKRISLLPDPALKNFLIYIYECGLPLKIPYARQYYSNYYSINRLSQLASFHLFDLQFASYNYTLEDILSLKSVDKKVNLFLHFFHQTLFTYLCSKFINPHLKCDLYMDLKEKLEKKGLNQTERQGISLALTLQDILIEQFQENTIKIILLPYNNNVLFKAAYTLGQFWADILFEKIYDLSYKITMNYLTTSLFSYPLSLEDLAELKRYLFYHLKVEGLKKRTF